MKKIILWNRDNPWTSLAIVAVISIFFGYHARNIKFDVSADGMMLENDPNKQFYVDTVKTFGTDNITIVHIRDKYLFTYDKLKAIEKVFYELKELKGVSRVDSLFNVTNFKHDGGGISSNPLMDEVPDDPAKLDEIKRDAMNNPVLFKNAITADGKGMAINILADVDPNDPDFNIRLANQIDTILSQLNGKVDKAFQIGSPLVRRSLMENILSDQKTLIPISALLLILTLLLGLRSLSGALLPLTTAALSVLWCVGFMALVGIPINVMTVIIPSILLVIGSAEDMHMVSEYFDGLEEGHDKMGAIEVMASHLGVAVFLTAATTVIGFWAVVYNDIKLLIQFGYASAFGMAGSFVITLMVIPVYLRFFGAKKSPFASSHKEGESESESWDPFRPLADFWIMVTTYHKRQVLVYAGAAFFLGLVGTYFVKVDNNFISFFKQTSDIQVRTKQLHEDLSGAHNFYITLEARQEGAFKKSKALLRIFEIQRYLEKSKDYDSSMSLASHIALINREMNGGNPEKYEIPTDDALIPQYLLLLQRNDIERFVTPDFNKANIVVRHNIASSYDFKMARQRLEAFVGPLVKDEMEFKLTGESLLINDAADNMASGQFQSIGMLLIMIFLIMWFLFVNIKAGVIAMVPNILPITTLFGIMGWLDIPLNTGTAMIADIAIGIAVDDTIHLMSRYNIEMKRFNDQQKAMNEVLKVETRPVLITAISLALGFLVLAASNFVPTIQFAVLSAIVMIVAYFTDALITPILCVSTRLITIWDMLSLKLRQEVLNNSPLFHNLKPWQIKNVVLLSCVESFKPGEFIIRQGDSERVMYLILSGSVDVMVTKGDNGEAVIVDTLKTGNVFGEIALIDEVVRTANVVARENTQILAVDWPSLESIQKTRPMIASMLFLNISKILGKRLAITDSKIHNSKNALPLRIISRKDAA